MEPSRSEVRARSGCDQFTSSPLVYLAISAVDVHCAVVSAGRFIIISGIYNFQSEAGLTSNVQRSCAPDGERSAAQQGSET
nr:uncharacterized protein LOC113823993 isoform X2 [Penaeus vannamei]